MFIHKYMNSKKAVQEGLSRSIGRIMHGVSAEEYEKAFASFTEKDKLLPVIKQIEKEQSTWYWFRSSELDMVTPSCIDFHGYAISLSLDENKNIILIELVGEKKNTSPIQTKKFTIWEPKEITANKELAKQVHSAFFEQYEYKTKLTFKGKTYTYNFWLEDYEYFDAYEQANHVIYDEIEVDAKRELTTQEFDSLIKKAQDELYKIAIKCAKRAENCKAGKAIGAKYTISKNKDGSKIDIKYNF